MTRFCAAVASDNVIRYVVYAVRYSPIARDIFPQPATETAKSGVIVLPPLVRSVTVASERGFRAYEADPRLEKSGVVNGRP